MQMMKDLFPEVPFIQGDTIALKALTQNDAVALQEFVDSPRVYRYLPTFLFEKKYDDVHLVIDRLYTECLEESLILGVFDKEGFGGLAEFYGYRPEFRKISLGCRFAERCWGKGIGTEAIRLMLKYLKECMENIDETDLNPVKEIMLKQAEDANRENGHWMDVLTEWTAEGVDLQTGYAETVKALTPQKISNFLREIVMAGNHASIVMMPEK